MFAGDRVRRVPFYAILVDAELFRGNHQAAAEAATQPQTAAGATTNGRSGRWQRSRPPG